MGVTASTPAAMVLGPGNLTVDGVAVGATQENATFKLARQAYKPSNNHQAAPISGAVYVFEEIPSLTVTLGEFELQQLLTVLPMGEIAGDGTAEAEVLTSKIGRLPDEAFVPVEYVVTPGDGRTITLRILAATIDFGSDFEAEFGNEAEGAYEVTFVGHADPADATKAPYEIERALAA